MKRLTDTEIWEEDWFIDLPNKYKLFWFYIKDKCDSAGIWRPNISNFQKIVGEPLSIDDFLQYSNKEDDVKIMVLPSKKWFIIKFFTFQYGHVFNLKSPVHRGVLKQLVSNGISLSELHDVELGELQNLDNKQIKQIAYLKGTERVLEGLQKAIDRDKDPDKDKDKDPDKDPLEKGTGRTFTPVEIVSENDTIVGQMIKVWQDKNPQYPLDKEKDFAACWQIALKIGVSNNWQATDIVNGKLTDVLELWKGYVDFIHKDNFYSRLQLTRINTEWQGLVFKKLKPELSKSKTKDMSGGHNTGITDSSVYDKMKT